MSHLRPINRQLATVHCGNCESSFTVTRDENGSAAIETSGCNDLNCNTRTCVNCTFRCFSCDGTFCEQHVERVGNRYYCTEIRELGVPSCAEQAKAEVSSHAA